MNKAKIREALGLLASVIKSGESWTERCQEAYQAAFAALDDDGWVKRLENWKDGDKGRAVEISHDNGYGASCWEVELIDSATNTRIIASEVFFIVPEGDDGDTKEMVHEKDGWKIYGVATVSENEMDGWPGLTATIMRALDKFDELPSPPETNDG